MHRDVEGQALIAPSRKLRHEHEMTGARNGQELSEALHHGKHDSLQPGHDGFFGLAMVFINALFDRRARTPTVGNRRASAQCT